MKIYIWKDVHALSQWMAGVVMASGEDVSDARNKALKFCGVHMNDKSDLKELEEELPTIVPVVVEVEDFAFYEYGSA